MEDYIGHSNTIVILPVSHRCPVDSNGGHVQVSGYEQVPPFMHGGLQSAGFKVEDLLGIVAQYSFLPVSHLSPVDSDGGHVQILRCEQVPSFIHGGIHCAVLGEIVAVT